MKKLYIVLSFLCLHSYFCVGQSQESRSVNSVEGVKMAYLTKELNLTPAESQKFWPIYGNYFSEIKLARRINSRDEVAFEEKVVEVRKKYKGDFKVILNSDARVNHIFVCEKNLRDMLKRELQNRQRLRRMSRPRQLPNNKNNF